MPKFGFRISGFGLPLAPKRTGVYVSLVRRSIQPSWIFVVTLLSPMAAVAEKVSVASIEPADLVEYETEPEAVKRLIEVSLALTKKPLGYRFGSNSPEKGGMDCSGTVQCALARHGFEKLPRSSWDFYRWVEDSGALVLTPGVTTTEDAVFEQLRPGDLLFWEGSYETVDRDPPISHVMIYLGTLKGDGQGVVFGASEGRRYRGKKIHGVSVFDWTVPKAGSNSKFTGYGPIPGLRPVAPESPPGGAKVLKTLLEKLVKKP